MMNIAGLLLKIKCALLSIAQNNSKRDFKPSHHITLKIIETLF